MRTFLGEESLEKRKGKSKKCFITDAQLAANSSAPGTEKIISVPGAVKSTTAGIT